MGIFAKATRDEKNNFMVYGHPGSGKTHMLGTLLSLLGEKEKIALLDFRSGTNTLFSCFNPTEVGRKVMVARPRTFSQITMTLSELSKGVGAGVVKWVAIDNLTSMQRIIMSDIRSVKVYSKTGKVEVIPSNKPSLDEWGMNIDRMMEVTSYLIDLPINVVFTAFADSKSEVIKPALDGRNLSDDISGMCDTVLYLCTKQTTNMEGKDEPQYICLTQPIENVLARSRNGVLEAVIEPNFKYIIDKLEAAYGSKTNP